jgi:hypothetical protein
LVDWSVGRARPSQPFYTLRATPKTALNFGRLVGWSVGSSVSRSGESHMNVMLPLQFRHPGPPFPTLLCPAGHPQNGLKFWSVGQSRGSHMNVTLPLQFFHLVPLFPTLLCPAGHPQNGLKLWSVGRSVSWSVGRSRESHTNVIVPFPFRHPGLPLPTLLRPAGHPQNGLKFWLIDRSVGQLVGQLVGHVEVTQMSRCLFSFVTRPALPDPSTHCGPPPKRT